MKQSLIDGKSQPLQKLRIKGEVQDGLCSAAFVANFENKRDEPIEVSFTLPLPMSVCATHFTVKYNGNKISSRISASDDARLEYDDAIAQSDFAALAQNNDKNELRIDLGPLAPTETAKISLHFDIPLTPLSDGYLLILPTSISEFTKNMATGANPPKLGLQLTIKDHSKITSIATPFTETEIDIEKGTVKSSEVSVFHPLHVVIKLEEPNYGKLIYQTIESKSVMRIITTAPSVKRDHNTQFTVFVEQGNSITSAQTSLITRALEFFVLSLPLGSMINIACYGSSSQSFSSFPVQINDGNRNEILNFVRKIGVYDSESPHITFAAAEEENLASFDNSNIDSVVAVIGSALPEGTTVRECHRHFVLDPFSRGDLSSAALAVGAVYVPTPDEGSLIGSLLSVIKMTSSAPIEPTSLVVNGQEIPFVPLLPSMTFSAFAECDFDKIEKAELLFGGCSIALDVIKSDMRAIATAWAMERIRSCGPEEAEQLAIAHQLLTPNVKAVAVIERDEEINGDVMHIESKLGPLGVQWVSHTPLAPDPVPVPAPDPTPIPAPIHPMPQPVPFPMPRPIHPMPQPMPYPISYPMPRVFPFWLRKKTAADGSDKSPARSSDSGKTSEPMMYFDPSAVASEARNLREEAEKRRRQRTAVMLPLSKKPFFLLRLLQAQGADGAWRDEKPMRICCGFPIPEGDFGLGLDRPAFLTAFALACLRAKAAADEDKWELCAEKAFFFLSTVDPKRDWAEVVDLILSKLA